MSNTRVANLASAFQEVLTVVVRVRFHLQIVPDAEIFRIQIRQLLGPVMRRARTLGYTNDTVQASVFAVVALLDESILNLQDSAFTNWARQPLQEELFGGHLAGETFFHNLRNYLSQSDCLQLADVLELHCLCLLLGYRGRYALGDSGEMHAMLQQARARIVRIRGNGRLLPVEAVEVEAKSTRDRDLWSKCLLWTAGALTSLLLILFAAYSFSLASGVSALQSLTLARPAQGAAEDLPSCTAVPSYTLCAS